jgi:hypothetical protein
VNSVSFAGERGERLVTGTRRVLFFLSLSVRGRAKERERERETLETFFSPASKTPQNREKKRYLSKAATT